MIVIVLNGITVPFKNGGTEEYAGKCGTLQKWLCTDSAINNALPVDILNLDFVPGLFLYSVCLYSLFICFPMRICFLVTGKR